MSQQELACKIGITQSLLSKYEVGKLNIPVEIIKLIEELPAFDNKTILKMIDTTLNASGLSIE